jgi:ABC-type lipoprotein export system ATPase subunit/ABC-type antimicrobial peptide transport system permease subunit
VLEVKNLYKTYNHKAYKTKQVLKGINVEFVEGEIVFVVGKSGCGKTTLLNIIGGLDSADTGTVSYNGKVVTHRSLDYKKNDVCVVFQDFNLIPGLSIKQNIAIAKREYDPEWIDTNVNQLGLESSQKARYLSGGESQRLALLRALYKDAKVVLADEPTGNLDSENAEIVFEYFGKLREQGKIVIVVSHDIESAERYGDRIIRLQDGVVVSDQRLDRDSTYIDDKVVPKDNGSTYDLVAKVDNSNNSAQKSAPKRYFADGVLTLNNMKSRLFRTISLVVLIAMTVCLLGLTISFGNAEAKKDAVRNKVDDIDLVEVRLEEVVDQQVVDKIANINGVNAVIPQYGNRTYHQYSDGTYGTASWLVLDTLQAAHTPKDELYSGIMAVDYSDFFRDRIMTSQVQGKYIDGPNQIIIDKKRADLLFGNNGIDPIGKVVYAYVVDSYRISYKPGVPMTIVGVNNRIHNNDNICYSYISYEFMRDIYESELEEGDLPRYPRMVNAYIQDPSLYLQFVSYIYADDDIPLQLSSYGNLPYTSVWREITKGLEFNVDHIIMMVTLFSIIVTVIMIVVLCIFLRLGLVDRLYEIAVVRSFGFGTLRVFGLYVLEHLCVVVMAIVPLFVFSRILDYIFVKYNGDYAVILGTTLLDNVLAMIATFGVCVVAILLLVGRVATQKVSALLKKSK